MSDHTEDMMDQGVSGALGTLSWIVQQAEGAMAISAGASQTSGDPEGALQMLNSIASDIAINAEMLAEKLVAARVQLEASIRSEAAMAVQLVNAKAEGRS